MFDEHESKRRQFDPRIPAKIIACGGVGILLSFGLCGAAAAIPGQASSAVSAGLGISGLVLLGLSIISILVGIIWLLIAAMMNAFSR